MDWKENESRLYRQLIDVAVPAREQQLASLLTLLPISPEAPGRVVELGAGTGALSFAVLEAFPRAKAILLDGSESMRRHASERLGSFGERVESFSFELGASDWLHHVEGANAVLSSLCIHHLNAAEKKKLFARVHDRLSNDGALLIADLVAPQRPEARELFAASWDLCTRERAESAGSLRLWEAFRKEEWNVYRFPDPADKPSPLVHQLSWLSEAGFSIVDCFWLQAGHAIYGGYRGEARISPHLDYSHALAIARRAVEKTR